MCGEQALIFDGSIFAAGSSPRVRGTALNCTANTGSLWDHPRVCGEQCLDLAQALNNTGSSPRVRGTACSFKTVSLNIGIIPACAGNSLPNCFARFSIRDHPRVCGEQTSLPYLSKSSLGSSPRVRGTDAHLVLVLFTIRIIPACAGNSFCYCRTLCRA